MYGYPLIVLINHNGKMLDVSEAVADASLGDPTISRTRFLDIVEDQEKLDEYATRYRSLLR